MKYINLLALVIIFSSCAGPAHLPGLYMDTKGNVTTTLARGAVSKTGEACTVNYVGLVSLGDASIETARKNAGIKKIAYIDNSYTNILGFYQKYCTLVRGN